MTLRWNQDAINNPDYEWVAFKVCPECGMTWQGVLACENSGLEGAIPATCPDCECDDDEGADA